MMPAIRGAILRPRGGSSGGGVVGETANLNLYDFAIANGYSSGFMAIEIPAGVEIYSADAATPACEVGNFPPGAEVELTVKGTITGAGGAGGDGSNGTGIPGAAGQQGGTALDATAATAFTFRLKRISGSIIRGGGGGGGGGGASVYRDDVDGFPIIRAVAAGGGGGGGRGRVAGTPGLGKASFGLLPVDGANGSGRNGGAGGSTQDISYITGNPYAGGRGGNGGDYGQNGQAGTAGSPPEPDVGPLGPAGRSINGIANVIVLSSAGSLIGPTA